MEGWGSCAGSLGDLSRTLRVAARRHLIACSAVRGFGALIPRPIVSYNHAGAVLRCAQSKERASALQRGPASEGGAFQVPFLRCPECEFEPKHSVRGRLTSLLARRRDAPPACALSARASLTSCPLRPHHWHAAGGRQRPGRDGDRRPPPAPPPIPKRVQHVYVPGRCCQPARRSRGSSRSAYLRWQ